MRVLFFIKYHLILQLIFHFLPRFLFLVSLISSFISFLLFDSLYHYFSFPPSIPQHFLSQILSSSSSSSRSEWSPCTATCGKGIKARTRLYINPNSYGICDVELMQKMPCLADKPDCTLDIADAKGNQNAIQPFSLSSSHSLLFYKLSYQKIFSNGDERK